MFTYKHTTSADDVLLTGARVSCQISMRLFHARDIRSAKPLRLKHNKTIRLLRSTYVSCFLAYESGISIFTFCLAKTAFVKTKAINLSTRRDAIYMSDDFALGVAKHSLRCRVEVQHLTIFVDRDIAGGRGESLGEQSIDVVTDIVVASLRTRPAMNQTNQS